MRFVRSAKPPLYIVDQIGETDFHLGPRQADGSNDRSIGLFVARRKYRQSKRLGEGGFTSGYDRERRRDAPIPTAIAEFLTRRFDMAI